MSTDITHADNSFVGPLQNFKFKGSLIQTSLRTASLIYVTANQEESVTEPVLLMVGVMKLCFIWCHSQFPDLFIISSDLDFLYRPSPFLNICPRCLPLLDFSLPLHMVLALKSSFLTLGLVFSLPFIHKSQLLLDAPLAQHRS